MSQATSYRLQPSGRAPTRLAATVVTHVFLPSCAEYRNGHMERVTRPSWRMIASGRSHRLAGRSRTDPRAAVNPALRPISSRPRQRTNCTWWILQPSSSVARYRLWSWSM
jgi:hypothetical protein